VHRYPYLKGNYGLKIRDEASLGQPGLTYTNLGNARFSARLMPPTAIFDDTGPAILTDKIDLLTLLGLMNSTTVEQLLTLINPSIHFQKGDLERLPVPPIEDLVGIGSIAARCVRLCIKDETRKLVSRHFKVPANIGEMTVQTASHSRQLEMLNRTA
jgi:hypothetical protein